MIINVSENEYVKCELDDSLPVLQHRWKKEPPGEAFKANLIKILESYSELKNSYTNLAWLADTTLLGELDEWTEKWLVDVWEHLLFEKAGLKIHAVILGSNIFADYPMEQFKADAEKKFKQFNVHLGVFSTQADAYRWIREQQVLIND
jgi:hypothetical protein